MADFSDLRNRIVYAVGLAAIGLTCLAFELSTLLFLGVLMLIFYVEVAGTLIRATDRAVGSTAVVVTFVFLMLGSTGFSAAILIRYEDHGFYSLLLVALGVAATDIFAYVGGKRFGRTKFAPKISPNKTWEGVIIGMLAGALMVLVTWNVLEATSNTSLSSQSAILIGFCLPVVAVCGDLLESKTKRLLEVKDFSTLLGSHGGVADRFDAMTAGFLLFGLVSLMGL